MLDPLQISLSVNLCLILKEIALILRFYVADTVAPYRLHFSIYSHIKCLVSFLMLSCIMDHVQIIYKNNNYHPEVSYLNAKQFF